MHSFLRAIGFSKCKTSKDVNKIIKYALENGETRKMSEDEEAVFGLIEKSFRIVLDYIFLVSMMKTMSLKCYIIILILKVTELQLMMCQL